MKAAWSTDYLNSKMSGREQAEWRSRKEAQLLAKTGVRWSAFHAHGQMIFNPVLEMRNVPEIGEDALVEKLVDVCKADRDCFGYVGFKRIQENSGLTYLEVMGIAKGLIKNGRATCGVDRMGKANSIKIIITRRDATC